MDKKPRIGVTGNHRSWSPSWWCTKLALILAGAQPERISVKHQRSGKSLDGLIIGGGDDIDPEHYGGEASERDEFDPERDKLEIEWIRWALENNVPILGICRGSQLVNVVHGGNLYSDISTLRKRTYNRPGLLPTKQVFVDRESDLFALCGKPKLRVNSLHHQAVKDVGDGLRVVGRDLDGFVQAIESTQSQPIRGVQWHPEYMFYLPSQFKLFRWLVRQCC
ncbi:gamma-glutamyl-gamma-aminobutyrate hydrolase family protein [Vibrio sp. EA2]|uniref:gamma-glutamyl-gamma-aminobutyrate hydrolase family protein n=1 Tax=Vibrio sp. EA2 TaxID=3079860 RepID=UPI00294A0D24|nr:gamma-glutamyl-gamma-aminobutyrate hydrolase family protein [Vibrio sp. EA2]MDV6249815.1 gamma-glutamyl-gamma-aminobutyrate hydrolase family protein [Vibrio sp. EA2]